MSDARLQRCIRDLSALSALPSLCVGRAPEEALDILLDALPTALSCDLVSIRLPGGAEGGRLHGRAMTSGERSEIAAATAQDADGCDAQLVVGGERVFCLEAEIPVGAERGRLLSGRASPLDPATDRILVRTAANVVGAILASANVLDAARRKDDFLAMLGHELRNPLAPILTAVELLARHPDACRERDVIERNTRHLMQIVDDLLDISRVTRGHVELRREYVSLGAVLDRAVELASPMLVRQRHELRMPRSEGVFLQGDPVRLAQVFGNLLTNAAKFTAPGGTIDVAIRRTADRVHVAVRDNGCGIAPDQLARIFEPFVQADRRRDALRGGLGLGLAIVKNLVQRHGGRVSVESAGLGHGAEFTVELPTVARAEPREQAVGAEPLRAHTGVRVLVVDDNVDIADMLSEALAREGFETLVAHDGRAALASWREFLPQAAVLDVGLPDLDGYELARALRAEYGAVPTLIAATGYGQASDRFRATDAGFDCHLVKPVSVRQILSVLDERLASRRQPD